MIRASAGVRHVFVVAPWDHLVSGGNIYNERLLEALEQSGFTLDVVHEVEHLEQWDEGAPRVVWVDSLYLDRIEVIKGHMGTGEPLYLMMHYLPTLVDRGDLVTRDELSDVETRALAAADGFLVTGAFMGKALRALGVDASRIVCVEPGIVLPEALEAPSLGDSLHAVMVANIVEGKGILPLLEALGGVLKHDEPLVLQIIGSLTMDPEYGQACEALVKRYPQLRSCVYWLGQLPHDEVLRVLCHSQVMVSASRMESYGMALAMARACGVPILARDGGNVSMHVDPAAGGQLVADEARLAQALVELAREPTQQSERLKQAWEGRRRPSTWAEVAAAFVRGFHQLVALPR